MIASLMVAVRVAVRWAAGVGVLGVQDTGGRSLNDRSLARLLVLVVVKTGHVVPVIVVVIDTKAVRSANKGSDGFFSGALFPIDIWELRENSKGRGLCRLVEPVPQSLREQVL